MTDIVAILALSRQGKSPSEIAALCLTSWQRVQEIITSHRLPRAVARKRRATRRSLASNGVPSLTSAGSAPPSAAPVLSVQGSYPTDFGAACIAHWPALRRYALSLTRCQDRAEDLVQDTFVRALEKRHLFQDGTDLSAWLIHMLHNILVSDVIALVVAYVQNVKVPLAQKAKAAAKPA